MLIELTAPHSLEATGTIEDALDPCWVIEIPANGLTEAALEILLRSPAQLGAGATGVDGVAEVVTRTVRDVGDRRIVLLAVGTRTEFIEQSAKLTNKVDGAALVVATDAIGATRDALGRRGEQGSYQGLK